MMSTFLLNILSYKCFAKFGSLKVYIFSKTELQYNHFSKTELQYNHFPNVFNKFEGNFTISSLFAKQVFCKAPWSLCLYI